MNPEIEQALKRIDDTLAKVSGTGVDRAVHVRLAMDVELIRKELAKKVEKVPETPQEGQTDKKVYGNSF